MNRTVCGVSTMIEFQIELRPHVGQYHDTRLGTRTVEQPQWMLFYHDAEMERGRGVYWTQIGFVGHHTTTIEFLPHARGLGMDTVEAICKRVETMTGTSRSPNMPPQAGFGIRSRSVKDMDAND